MDSRIIDVAIGLVLVFALTSLLIATLVEALSTWRMQRGRVLTQAITSFLGDNAPFASAVLEHPLLVSLAQGARDDDRRPSYIGTDVMITSLIAYLTQYTQGVRPSSPAELVAAVQAGLPPGATFAPANLDFQKGLSSLLAGVENDWQGYEKRLQAWYDSVTQRSSGWYKRWANRWLFILGFVVAAAANINPIVIGPRLWNDAALREAVVTAGQEASKQYEQQRALSASNATTPATTGTAALPATTLTTVVATNASAPATVAPATVAPATLQLAALIQQPLPRRVLESEPVAHNYALLEQSLVDAANAASKNPKDNTAVLRGQIFQNLGTLPGKFNDARMPDDGTTAFLDKREKANVAIDAALAALKALIPADTATDTSYKAARGYRDQLETSVAKERDALSKKVEPKSKRTPKCDAVEDAAAKDLCLRMNDLTQLHDAGLPIGWSPPAWPDLVHLDSDATCLADTAPAGDKSADTCDHLWHAVGNTLAAIAGWLITAIASTLGAPFWFDLLGRLVKLRGSGTRIDGDKGGDGADQKATTMSASSTPATASTTASEPMSDALNAQEIALSQSDIQRIQRVLGPFGAQVTSTFDGVTRDAIKKWQAARGGQATGELTQAQIAELLGLGGDEYAG